jgi:hypothetical protein
MKGDSWRPELLPEFEDSSSVIYVIDGDFKIRYCNAAWDKFALENGGVHLVRKHQIGRNVMDVTPPPLRPFYEKLFRAVLKLGEEMHCVYECSSDRTFRRFHMHVMRKKTAGQGSRLAIVNSPVSEVARRPSEARYDLAALREENGLVTMCSHCRRTRLPGQEARWVWLPDLVREMPREVSHGICPVCFDLHYRS